MQGTVRWEHDLNMRAQVQLNYRRLFSVSFVTSIQHRSLSFSLPLLSRCLSALSPAAHFRLARHFRIRLGCRLPLATIFSLRFWPDAVCAANLCAFYGLPFLWPLRWLPAVLPLPLPPLTPLPIVSESKHPLPV